MKKFGELDTKSFIKVHDFKIMKKRDRKEYECWILMEKCECGFEKYWN